jgi:hypothetical protein
MTTNKFTVVTTFNDLGYNKYGRRMIDTFTKSWPHTISLYVYAEDCSVDQHAANLHVFDLAQASPELVNFKRLWSNVPRANGDVTGDPVRNQRKDAGKGFKWDAVRFSHKVYAVFAAAKQCNTDWLLWMDADMVCHSPIPIEFINRMCPDNVDICFLGREGKYTECGLYALNLTSPTVKLFLQKFQQAYDDAEQGIFTYDEWHDSFVFDQVRRNMQLRELNWSAGIIRGEGHPLINSEWGKYLDHLKGDRKALGHSKIKDLKVVREESYWKTLHAS